MSDDAKLYRCMGGAQCTHTPGSCTATNTEYQAKAKSKAPPSPYTVIFYVDGDYAVHTFVEHVMAKDTSEAWRIAIKQADKGYLTGCDFDNATEIITLSGHLEAA